MTHILIAGIGNIFLGDDGFGVEVAHRLLARPVPAGATVIDAGIRGMDLAFRLLDPVDLLVLIDAVDATAQTGGPGTLYVIEPEVDAMNQGDASGHGMNLPGVFALVRAMGGTLPRMLLVGCKPASLDEQLGLSPLVEAAIEPALGIIEDLCARERERPSRPTTEEDEPCTPMEREALLPTAP